MIRSLTSFFLTMLKRIVSEVFACEHASEDLCVFAIVFNRSNMKASVEDFFFLAWENTCQP